VLAGISRCEDKPFVLQTSRTEKTDASRGLLLGTRVLVWRLRKVSLCQVLRMSELLPRRSLDPSLHEVQASLAPATLTAHWCYRQQWFSKIDEFTVGLRPGGGTTVLFLGTADYDGPRAGTEGSELKHSIPVNVSFQVYA